MAVQEVSLTALFSNATFWCKLEEVTVGRWGPGQSKVPFLTLLLYCNRIRTTLITLKICSQGYFLFQNLINETVTCSTEPLMVECFNKNEVIIFMAIVCKSNLNKWMTMQNVQHITHRTYIQYCRMNDYSSCFCELWTLGPFFLLPPREVYVGVKNFCKGKII